MQKFDVLIVGGGMVGLTTALAISKNSDLRIAIVDTQPLAEITAHHDVRVSAINRVSQQLFVNLDVWQDINNSRVQPYQHMHIWDKAGYGHIDFDLSDLSKREHNGQLGWIIENSIIRQALWKKAEQDENICFFTQEKLTNIAMGDSEVFASFSTQPPITAKLVIGADGANSWVRQQMKMALTFRDYDHHAIVATVKCPQGHQQTAWQVFLETGPLALLPLADNHSADTNIGKYKSGKDTSDQDHLCSIVWSTSPEEAKRLLALSESEFSKALTAASDGKLGNISLASERFSYPLTMRFAQNFIKDRVVLVGDAAHTIHPLAGQGVNLGLLDAAAIAQILTESLNNEQGSVSSNSAQWLSPITLKQYERWRKTEAAEMIGAMEAIKQTFTPQQAPIKFLRGIGMSIVNQIKPAKNVMIKQALGFKNHLPHLSKVID
ncbi:FAD-dependent monooxygenase [Colwellia sp. 1_MG-2023]|uniref:FAD-dependent monooxygenase n=1 Tax=Colwellia sp. 1_MG-2023 TaxID=3062649 RepID=UPI0026E1753E|nr:FAD-dependent monooxygenase [Colwellia sp. 1_MG-2023]MDO6445879.1 FAD-dependent monooxygenase [Colwellia sp. 1_MG-2023]